MPSSAGLDACPTAPRSLFTAHSLPERILETGDPYPDQLRATAEAVAGAAGIVRGWSHGVAERGPHARAVARARHPRGASTTAPRPARAGVLVCPCGFVSDHLEILYDLDIEARAVAEHARRLPFAAHGHARTTIPRSSASWPTWSAPGSQRDARRRVTRDARVVVVGGGITGLATAHYLKRRHGLEVVVVEASDRVGGKIRTDELAGVPVEAGPDSFLARVPWAADLCRELGLGDDADRARDVERVRAGRAAGCARCRPGWCWACRPGCRSSPAAGWCRPRGWHAPRSTSCCPGDDTAPIRRSPR